MNRPSNPKALPADEKSLQSSPAKEGSSVAQAIIEEAQRRGTDIGNDAECLALFSRIDGEEQIPRELYVAIAAVLSWMDSWK